MMKKLLLLSILILLPMLANATVVIDGIYYNLINGNEAEVTENPSKYLGSVVIPQSVVYGGKTYSVTSISDYAFYGCSGLTSVPIPNSVTSIGNYAFAGCSGLTSVTIPNSVTSIGNYAFAGCSGLTSVTIPNSVTSIGFDVLSDCSDLASITVESGNTVYDSRENCNAIIKTESNELIVGCKNTVIPNSVISIGFDAFFYCSGLTSMTIPNSVTSIGEGAFMYCSGLTSVTIPNSVTSIRHYAFSHCSSLTSVTIPNSVTSIGSSAFSHCSSLTSMTIPNSVTSIGSSVFYNCSSLTSVTIPNSMTSIGHRAFSECSSLTSVKSEIQTPFSIDDDVFDMISSDAILQVPKGTKSKYELFSGWTAHFKEIREANEGQSPTNYTLSVKVTGNGSVSYDGTTIRNRTTSFTVNEGTYATINFAPDNGYRIKNVKENYYNVTSQVRNNSYTTYISGNTTIEVEFEAIPPTTYSLSIKATGDGSASYDGTTIRNRTSSFILNEGSNAMITFTPDNGYQIKSLMVNNADETANISNNTYTISNISRNTTVEVVFEEDINAFTVDGVNYTVKSFNEKTVAVSKGNYGAVLEIPAKVTYQNVEWKVTSIESNILSSGPDLCAIIWNPEAAFTENVSNPNLLLYVKSANYAPQSIKNVVVNNRADNITLVDAADGNNFYCPLEFTAKSISYTHHYKMETGINESKGWETIALPFDVQRITHKSKGEIVPFANWKSGDSKKPFWLKQLGSSGWTDAQSIEAYTPYIISMPNNTKYKEEFKLNGDVTFSAENVKIGKTENLTTSSFNGRTFVPNFSVQSDKSCYALNVNNDYVYYQGNRREGSMFFIGLRDIHPFEAYIKTASGTRAIAIEDDITTGIEEIKEMLSGQKDMKVYNLKGQLIKTVEGKTMDEVRKTLPAGIYIVNGQKLIIK